MQRQKRLMTVLTAIMLTGTCFQFGGCNLGGIPSFLSNFNPCGTILNCDPVEYTFSTSGYVGPGADPSVDPACTYPPYCAGDPFVTSTADTN